MTTPVEGGIDQALALVDLALRASRAYRRPDLAQRLEAVRSRVTTPDTRVLVAGGFKQGKSTLINAVLQAPVCPVDADVATAVVTLVRHAGKPEAVVHLRDGEDERVERVPVAAISRYACEPTNGANRPEIQLVEAGLPWRLLEGGLALLDTPGLGGIGSLQGLSTLAAVPTAAAVVMVTDASQELTEPELRFLAHARDLCPTVLCALTKIDLYPAWRKVAALDREHLDERGFEEVEVLPLSAPLRSQAVAENDRAMNEESGYAALVGWLRHQVVGNTTRMAAGRAVDTVVRVTRMLASDFDVERAALADPAAALRLQDELEAAQVRSERLRSESARWQTSLADGMADLGSDIDHDLRSRTRRLLQEAEERIDAGDPLDWWDEFEPWLRQRLADDVVENYQLLVGRAEAVAHTVADQFSAAEEEVSVVARAEAPVALLDDLGGLAAGVDRPVGGIKGAATSVATTSYSMVRGSYGGLIMFRMLGSMIGLGAMNPAVIGLTLCMGRKSFRDERHRQLGLRRQQAKATVRRYLDEASFQVGKDSRDALRRVQRQLRDELSSRAEELSRSVSGRLTAAQQAAQTEGGLRDKRRADVEAELARLRALEERALLLAEKLSR